MERLAVVTLVTSPEWHPLADVTVPTQKAYADRVGADMLVLNRRVFAHPHYDKWQLHEILGQYDRVLYLDADVAVRPDCPDLFVTVPPERFGGENELASFPAQADHLATFMVRMGMPVPTPVRFYFNGGVFVASRAHRNVFRPPEAIHQDLPWPEQSHLNARLMAERVPVLMLPPVFNDRHRRGDYLRGSFVLHYSVMPMPERVAAAQRDVAGWAALFKRDRPAIPS